MTAASTNRVARAVGVVIVSVPVCFGALRALVSGGDFRYLVTACASLVAAGSTFRWTAGRIRSPWIRSLLALGLSTVLGAIVAFGEGASSVAAVFAVAIGFAVCVTLGGMLGAFAKRVT